MELVSNLSKALCLEADLEEQVNCPADLTDVSTFVLELSSLLKEMNCPYYNLIEGPSSQRLSTKVARYNLVNFLCSELEAAQILSEARRRCSDLHDGKSLQSDGVQAETAEALKELLIALEFSKPPNSATLQRIFERLTQRALISQCIRQQSTVYS
ncbi:hypothetical protein D918_06564 [Trichuris suis]|nr:hypothetical protein D918_06564 [Trichuris suis]